MRNIIIVKVGSSSLVGPDGAINYAVLNPLASQVAQAREFNCYCVVVTSGATMLGFAKAPWLKTSVTDELASSRLAAFVGQPELACAWQDALALFGLTAGQILTTHADVENGEHSAFLKMALEQGLVPVINEDDTRSPEEMKSFLYKKGDNDWLAYHVARAVDAERVLLLTDVPGVCEMNEAGECVSDPVPYAHPEDEARLRGMVRDRVDGRPTGMPSKMDVAFVLQREGITAHIAAAWKWVLIPILEGKQVGTTFPAR